MTTTPSPRIAVIGAGPVGIAAGRALRAAGLNDFTIFEKQDAPGGTWHLHSYPGLACDVKAYAYVFTDGPHPDWSANYVEQAEIDAYLQRCATEFGLDPHIRLNTEILRAVWDGESQWELETTSGDRERFDLVINAMGNQHTPTYPSIEGRERFRGDSWHATNWNHEVDLSGKRVAVVGSAASAVQIVPELAKQVEQLFVLQRTPNWILPRGRKPYSPLAKAIFRHVPGAARAHRFVLDLMTSLSHDAAQPGNKMMDRVEDMGRKNLEGAIEDPQLREWVTPTSRFGCKRPLVSDDYYPALTRDNVRLIPTAAREITETGLVTAEGEAIDVDVIVFCTGYKVLDYERIEVVGEDGRVLGEVMEKAPEAYKGVAVPGFPNYFFGVGPNGALLSASFFTALEINLASVIKVIQEMQRAGVRAVSVKESLHREHNDWIASAREKYAWGVADCDSYYRLPSGHTPFLFPGDLKTFKRQRAEAGLHEYDAR